MSFSIRESDFGCTNFTAHFCGIFVQFDSNINSKLCLINIKTNKIAELPTALVGAKFLG